jgi:hypothetical protein
MTERFGSERTKQKMEPNIWVKLSILRSSQTQHTPEQSNSAYSGANTPEQNQMFISF